MEKQFKCPNDDRFREVDRQLKQWSERIAESLTKLLFDEKTNTKKMASQLCAGIIGLTLAASKRRDLIAKGAKEDLSKFVVKEMERVRKQYGLKQSDVYK